MMGKSSWKDRSEKIDEHSLPTEPLPPLVLMSPHTPVVLPAIPEAMPGSPASEHSYPQPYMVTKPAVQPYPYVPTAPAAPPYPYSQQQPLTGTYPYLPLAPAGQQGQKSQAPARAAKPTATSSRKRNRTIPFSVGFCFVALQLLLLVRFCSKLINLPDNQSWTGPVYALSAVFVAPFHSLIQPYTVGIPSNIELYTLLAVLVYGLGSRLLVRCLKALL